MSSELSALLGSWDFRPEIIAVLSLAVLVYSLGWARLRPTRRRTHRTVKLREQRLASGWRLASYLSGISILVLALMSPIDVLGGHLFFMHMIQHLMLIMFIPPLLLIANPLPFILWGLPDQTRRHMGQWLSNRAYFRKTLKTTTRPGYVWIILIVLIIGWHDPVFYNAALSSDLVHDLEHISFFCAGMLFWWHITGAGPHVHGHFTSRMRIAYLLAMLPPTMLTGVTIAFATQPIYTYYKSVPRLWGMTLMQDQMLGGIIMWIPGSMMYILSALIIFSRLFSSGKNQKPVPNSVLDSDEVNAATVWQT